jgi:hypothetical protein
MSFYAVPRANSQARLLFDVLLLIQQVRYHEVTAVAARNQLADTND